MNLNTVTGAELISPWSHLLSRTIINWQQKRWIQ